MATIELIRSFLEQASAQGSRTTALNPLGWLIALLLAGITSCTFTKADAWVTGAVTILCCVAVACYLMAYGFFAFTNVDALRSEKYTLSKMAIEKTMVGDNLVGILDATDIRAVSTDEPRIALTDEANQNG